MAFRRFFKNNLFLILSFLVVFLAGWQLGFAGLQLKLRFSPPGITVENKNPDGQSIDFSIMWDVIDRINADFLFRSNIDAKKLLYGAVSGLVESLGDPYTSFLDPDQNKQFSQGLEGVYEGIGAEIGIRSDTLIIVAPLDGSPAKTAGIRAGDKILEIDGESTSGMTLTTAVNKIRGAANTKVILTLQRGSTDPFKLTITRAQIKVKSVTWEDKGGGIAYIKISRFGDGTNDEWDSVVAEVRSKIPQLKGIVLDVRSNPGGYLSSAIYISSEFLRDGTVALEEDPNGQRTPLKVQNTKAGHIFSEVPVAILIDGGSASASEILSGALSERISAKLVGEKSFGKGTVQDAVEFDDGSGLHLTIAKWLTPKGNWVHNNGLEPNYKIELTESDINASRDPQLQKALELLK